MPGSNNQDPRQMVFVMQIIAFALIQGVLIFLLIAVFITQGNQPQQGQLTIIGIAFAVLALVGQAFVRLQLEFSKVEKETYDPRSDEALLAFVPVYQTELIIKLALLEGAAFFNGVAYLLEINWWSLAAMGALLAVMCFSFPTRPRITRWIERRTVELSFGRDEF